MAGTIAVDTIQNGSGASIPTTTVINGSAKAWVNFDGSTTPPTIRASFNVASVIRNGAGDYTVNFTNAMSDANYSVTFGARRDTGATGYHIGIAPAAAPTASACRIKTTGADHTTGTDYDYVCASVFR